MAATAAIQVVRTETRSVAGSDARNGGIDAVRAFVTLLVVFHHTALTYGAIGGWYFREILPNGSISSQLLIFFCTVNQAWFMGMFFLLAGYFTPPSFDRHGAAAFARERLLRLGLPLLAYFFLISPVTSALARVAAGRRFSGALMYRMQHEVFEPGPLWFAEALLIFSAIFIAWRVFRPSTKPGPKLAFPANSALLVAALGTGAAAFLLRLAWPVGVNVAALQIGYFASYIVLFAAGCAAAQGRWLENIPAGQAQLWRRIAWIALLVLPIVALSAPHIQFLQGRSEGGLNAQALTYAFWEPFVAWGFILGLLTFFQRRFTTLGGVWRKLARRAFLIYIIHPPILVAVAVAWRQVAAPALLKFAITGSIACLLCYLAAGLLLRIPAVARTV